MQLRSLGEENMNTFPVGSAFRRTMNCIAIHRLFLLIVTVTAFTVSALAQDIQKLDPGLEQLVGPDSKLERIATGFNKWTEGAVWTHEGTLLFAEIPANNIDLWVPGKGASVFMHPSGYTGAEPFKGPEPGSNGMILDPDGRVSVAGHARRNVWRMESLDPKAQITILADSYQGKKFNSPNDLVYKSDGSLYFTDPPYGLPTQQDNDPQKELQVNGVYRIPGARQQKPGTEPARNQLQLVIKDLPRPNGICFSPDEKYLYIADSGKKIWMRYRVQPDGSVADGALFLDASHDSAPGGQTASVWTKKETFTAPVLAGCGLFLPKGNTSAQSKSPRL